MATISAPHLKPGDTAFLESFDRKGFSLDRVSKVATPILWTATGIGLTAAFVASVVIPVSIPIIVISSIALVVFGAGLILFLAAPHLPVKMQNILNKVHGFGLELLGIIAVAAQYPISQTWFDPKKSEDINPNQIPILLVHGYLHNSSGWSYFRHRLKQAGHRNVFTINLGDPFLSIETYAERVKEKIEKIKEITGCEDIHLIGHSMGGVVSSYYATHLAPEKSVKSVQTLGSPLKGTRLKGVGMSAFQMRYKSSFIKDLRGRVKVSTIPFNHIGSHADLIVVPHKSMYLKNHSYALYPNLGHVSYLFSDRVIRNCALFLRTLEHA